MMGQVFAGNLLDAGACCGGYQGTEGQKLW